MKSIILAPVVLAGACLLLLHPAHSQDLTCQPLDIVFVIDRSGSIRDTNPSGCTIDTDCDNWELMRRFVNNLIDTITPTEDTRFGAVVFGNDDADGSNVVFTLTDDRTAAKNSISALQHRSHFTATYRGLRIMRQDVFTETGDRPDVPNLAIVITDGQPNLFDGGDPGEEDIPAATQDAFEEAQAAQNAGIIILAIGVTNRVDNNTIIGLASDGLQSNVPVSGWWWLLLWL